MGDKSENLANNVSLLLFAVLGFVCIFAAPFQSGTLSHTVNQPNIPSFLGVCFSPRCRVVAKSCPVYVMNVSVVFGVWRLSPIHMEKDGNLGTW
jgi:hypothetical protein